MSGGRSISTSETKAEALKLQSSAQGVTIAWVRGVNKVAGNLLQYNNLKAIPKTETQGGKGGGGTSNTTYTYTVDAIMGVCHGPILDIPRVWRGKAVYDGGVSTAQIKSTVETYAVPSSGAMTYTLGQAATYRAVLSVDQVISGPEQDGALAPGYDFVVSTAGVLTVLNEAYRNYSIRIAYQYTTGTENRSALQELGLTFARGAIGQALWSGSASYPTDQRIGYSGIAYVAGQAYALGSSAQLENHTFEVVGPLAYHLGSDTPDVDITLAMRELMMDSRVGAGFPAENMGDWSAWSDFCVASGTLGSPTLTTQVSMAELLAEAADATITGLIWSDGKLKAVPYADQPESGRGRTYIPDLSPVYDIDDDCFAPSSL